MNKKTISFYTIFAASALACRPVAVPRASVEQEPCGFGMTANSLCSAEGNVVVRAIDDRRILIAIDRQENQQPDGFVDDVFLYTATNADPLDGAGGQFKGHLEYSPGVLRVVNQEGPKVLLFVVPNVAASRDLKAGPGSRVFDHAIGLSHYAGWSGLRVARLNSLRSSAQCDGPAGACVEVDGIRIQFPA
ncbi:MAG TPA: hypothetical protein VJ852_09055 [Gemmatimonadaceae bacterium]|nr:hypothetical protein [Gemmatimonadaceae bacterium]